MISSQYILGFSLGCFLRNKPKGTLTTGIGTPIFQQYNIFGVEKQAICLFSCFNMITTYFLLLFPLNCYLIKFINILWWGCTSESKKYKL